MSYTILSLILATFGIFLVVWHSHRFPDFYNPNYNDKEKILTTLALQPLLLLLLIYFLFIHGITLDIISIIWGFRFLFFIVVLRIVLFTIFSNLPNVVSKVSFNYSKTSHKTLFFIADVATYISLFFLGGLPALQIFFPETLSDWHFGMVGILFAPILWVSMTITSLEQKNEPKLNLNMKWLKWIVNPLVWSIISGFLIIGMVKLFQFFSQDPDPRWLFLDILAGFCIYYPIYFYFRVVKDSEEQ